MHRMLAGACRGQEEEVALKTAVNCPAGMGH